MIDPAARKEIETIVLETLRPMKMDERDVHLKAVAAIERAYNIQPRTSDLRRQSKLSDRVEGLPPNIIGFISIHEDAGHLIALGLQVVIAIDPAQALIVDQAHW